MLGKAAISTFIRLDEAISRMQALSLHQVQEPIPANLSPPGRALSELVFSDVKAPPGRAGL